MRAPSSYTSLTSLIAATTTDVCAHLALAACAVFRNVSTNLFVVVVVVNGIDIVAFDVERGVRCAAIFATLVVRLCAVALADCHLIVPHTVV